MATRGFGASAAASVQAVRKSAAAPANGEREKRLMINLILWKLGRILAPISGSDPA
jgi:hypothetical protein